jgi:glycogen operon protein
VRGEYRPAQGLRFNEHKLLLDPYARALTGPVRNQDDLLLAYDASPAAGGDLSLDARDDTAVVPKCIVVDDAFDWQGDTSPDVPLESLLVYEVHAKGFTAHPSSQVGTPGTYLGFVERIPYLKRLGINAVELLPVHESYIDDFLIQKGLSNYWGYNSIGFFAPESSYSSQQTPGCQVTEFKLWCASFTGQASGSSDVVYNHTGEGNEMGPQSASGGSTILHYQSDRLVRRTFSLLSELLRLRQHPRLRQPPVIRLVMDSLRYWVEVMRGRLSLRLASVLGREEDGSFTSSAAFFDAVSQDPYSHVRSWLLSRGTSAPTRWATFQSTGQNGMANSGIRYDVSEGDAGQLSSVGWRMTGSADLYGESGRSAYNSVNFITCHMASP